MLEADIPQPDADGVVVEVKRSLISRGSELFKRYVAEEGASAEHDGVLGRRRRGGGGAGRG